MKDFKVMIQKELAHNERMKAKPEILKVAMIVVQDKHAKLLYYKHGRTLDDKTSQDFKEWFQAKLLALHPNHQLSKDANNWIERMFIEKVCILLHTCFSLSLSFMLLISATLLHRYISNGKQ
jgi:hypothetical protein